MRLRKLAPSRPPTFFSNLRQNRCKAETRRQFTGAHSLLTVLTKARAHCSTVHRKPADPKLTERLISRDSVNKNNYDTLIMALILAGLASWLMAPTAVALHRPASETSGTRSDPVLPSSGETISPPKKCLVQLPSVFTAAPHQTFIKCHLYSV